jgi:NTE family protein
MRHKTAEPKEARACLRASKLFGGLDDAGLAEVQAALEWMVLGGGEALMRVGDPGDGLYLVVTGRLAVVVHPPGRPEQVVRELGRTAIVGELSLVTGEPRTATVRALRDTVVGKLSRERFDQLVEEHPHIGLRLTRVLAEWVGRPERAPRTSAPSTVALLPLPGADLSGALAQLELGLGQRVRILDADAIDAQLGPGAARAPVGSERDEALTALFDAEETAHPLILFAADREWSSPWTQRAVRQADHVLVIASPRTRPDAPEVAAALASLGRAGNDRPKELVLVRDPSLAEPRGTAAWLRLAKFTRHHHVREGSARDWARIGRHLTGRTLGLVLGGGCARGFAHIGVLRALAEAGIDVDMVAGTSMGALIAAQCASGFDPREMIAQNRQLWLKRAVLRDYSLPVVALLGPRRAEFALKELFGDRQIEDLPREFFCVSTNLTKNECMAHRTGLVRHYVLASMSIPGVAPPIVEGGDLLVDGGVLNILPTDLMRQAGAGTIVAVDVSPLEDFSVDARHGKAPGPIEFLAGKLNPFQTQKGFPSIFHILERTAMLASSHISKSERMRSEIVYIDPPVSRFDTFDMKSLEEIAEIGYRAAVDRIREWRKGGGTLQEAIG